MRGVTSRSPSYKVDHIGRTVKSTKLRHAWTLHLGETEVKIELEHSRLSGKKKVLVDGKLLFSTTERHLNWCWEHPASKARINLISENGKHLLRCEEPDAAKETTEPADPQSDTSPVIEKSASFEPWASSPEPVLEEVVDPEAFESGDSPVRQNLSTKYANCEDSLQDQLASLHVETCGLNYNSSFPASVATDVYLIWATSRFPAFSNLSQLLAFSFLLVRTTMQRLPKRPNLPYRRNPGL